LNVETLCLAILYKGDATGYQIRKSLSEGEEALFADAGYGSIYPALKKLNERGALSLRSEVRDGRPSRKVFSITEKGRSEFLETLCKPLEADRFKSPFLHLMRFAGDLPLEIVQAHIDARRANLAAEVKKLDDLVDKSSSRLGDWILAQRRAMTCSLLEALDAGGPSHRQARLQSMALGRQNALGKR
jgi:PadR family transcriptional regulator AphA